MEGGGLLATWLRAALRWRKPVQRGRFEAKRMENRRFRGVFRCCSLSNNQWRIEEELGSGDLVRSSFYLALTDVRTVATVMLLDEEATALSRVWCLFEAPRALDLDLYTAYITYITL